jgi:hypothetical protein
MLHLPVVFSNKAFTKEVSPFLMFDYGAPKKFPAARSSKRRGVGQHPHRGFETVTIALQGEIQHRDSIGNSGIIGPGECQWMTAGRGIVHEEFHSEDFTRLGGIFEMCQIWVNLPKKYKMNDPKYQDLKTKDIPCVPLKIHNERTDVRRDVSTAMKDGYAKVFAGSFDGSDGPAATFTPINIWVVTMLSTEKEFEFDFIEGYTTLIFVTKGGIVIEGKTLNMADAALMNREGTSIVLKPTEIGTSILILSGKPIDEPIAARGPFVMNSQQELIDSMQDYQRGRNGFSHF